MLTRTVFESRHLPPGTRLTPTQWAAVQAFLAADDVLALAGAGAGKSFVRAALARYLLDADPDADAAAPEAREETAVRLARAPISDAVSAAQRKVIDSAVRLDQAAGRSMDNVPPHVVTITERVLGRPLRSPEQDAARSIISTAE